MPIIFEPVVTEKTLKQAAEGRYTFFVAPRANKIQIKKTIAELYKVEVIACNMANSKAEEKMVRGRFHAKIKAKKKAIVTLKKGQKIPGFGVEEKTEKPKKDQNEKSQ